MSASRPVLSPCTGVCTLDPAGYCDGCFRSGDEIAGWLSMDDRQRTHMMDVVLPEREARRMPSEGMPSEGLPSRGMVSKAKAMSPEGIA